MEVIKERKYAKMPSFVLSDESKFTYKNNHNNYDIIKNYIGLTISNESLEFLKKHEISADEIIARLNLMKSILSEHLVDFKQIIAIMIEDDLSFNFQVELDAEQQLTIESQYDEVLFNQIDDQIAEFKKPIDHLITISLISIGN